jgi:3-isopropylmalate/(R)-2-methylmalate dehydratase large subunit
MVETAARTLLDKVWDDHLVATRPDGEDLLYVDRHVVHEVSSPQAFASLRDRGHRLRRPDLTLAVSDHVVSTAPGRTGGDDDAGEHMLRVFRANTRDDGIAHLDVGDPGQGIVHVVAPELGVVRPGMTAVCGDSHTCTLGALGAVAWGIGSSEVEHVMATQTVAVRRPTVLQVRVEGRLPDHVYGKDVALSVIRRLGVEGGLGHALEYGGSAVAGLTMEERLTLCNMSVEAGSKIGYINPDATTVAYLVERGVPADEGWLGYASDPGAPYARTVDLPAAEIEPLVTWGVRPSESVAVSGAVPATAAAAGLAESRFERVLEYMGLAPGRPMRDVPVDVVFIGSCANSRISDLRAAAAVVGGRTVSPSVRAVVVPGSGTVRRQAEAEGLHELFRRAGFEWREPGCSFCVSVNGDRLRPGQRSVSTSNRNFEGRQGPGGRTHLASPAVAAASAVAGFVAGPADL